MVQETAKEGVYLFLTGGIPYVGQSQDVGKRLNQHLGVRLENMENVLGRFHFKGLSGSNNKVPRETIEQIILDSLGGIENTDNKRNPIGKKRKPDTPKNIDAIKKIICKGK